LKLLTGFIVVRHVFDDGKKALLETIPDVHVNFFREPFEEVLRERLSIFRKHLSDIETCFNIDCKSLSFILIFVESFKFFHVFLKI